VTPERTDWVLPPPRLELQAEEVHVWRVPLDGSTASDETRLAVLSVAERERASRFRFEADRRRYIGSHAALRSILATYLGATPSELVFGVGAHAKPFIDGSALRFSLSHSDNLALVAVASGREVGVDLERVRPVSDMARIAARFFSTAERQALEQAALVEQPRAFFATWVLKEAYLKACGDGLIRKLEDFDVTIEAPSRPQLLTVRDRPGDATRWTLCWIDPGEGYLAALAVEGSGWRLRQSHLGGSDPNTSL
jgi:4'-phosphopantetheinyl transferase